MARTITRPARMPTARRIKKVTMKGRRCSRQSYSGARRGVNGNMLSVLRAEALIVQLLRRGSCEAELLGSNLLQRAGVSVGDPKVARGLLIGAQRLRVPAGDGSEHDQGIQVGTVF